MIIVDDTSGSQIRLTLSAAVAVHVHASFVDEVIATAVISNAAPKDTTVSSTTPTAVVVAPATGAARGVQYMSFSNVDASLPVTALIEHLVGATAERLTNTLIPAQTTFQFTDNGWLFVPTSPVARAKKSVTTGTSDTLVGPLLSDTIIYWKSATAGAKTQNIPAGTGSGFEVTIVDFQGTGLANNITAIPAAGTINGSASGVGVIMDNYGRITLVDEATNSWVQKA